MNKLLFGLGAAVLGLVLTGDANAHETRGHAAPHATVHAGRGPVVAHAGRGPVVAARPYYLEHGSRYNGGYIYRGEQHSHWSYRVWNTRYNRYQYYDPTLRCYYYWNPIDVAYYPCD